MSTTALFFLDDGGVSRYADEFTLRGSGHLVRQYAANNAKAFFVGCASSHGGWQVRRRTRRCTEWARRWQGWGHNVWTMAPFPGTNVWCASVWMISAVCDASLCYLTVFANSTRISVVTAPRGLSSGKESPLRATGNLTLVVRATSSSGEAQCCLCDGCVHVRFGEERPTRLPDLSEDVARDESLLPPWQTADSSSSSKESHKVIVAMSEGQATAQRQTSTREWIGAVGFATRCGLVAFAWAQPNKHRWFLSLLLTHRWTYQHHFYRSGLSVHHASRLPFHRPVCWNLSPGAPVLTYFALRSEIAQTASRRPTLRSRPRPFFSRHFFSAPESRPEQTLNTQTVAPRADLRSATSPAQTERPRKPPSGLQRTSPHLTSPKTPSHSLPTTPRHLVF